MAGKQIGEFSFKATSLTYCSGPNDSLVVQINCQGEALGSTVALTVTCTPTKSGSYTALGAQYLDNGDVNTSRGNGSFESLGPHRWRTQGDVVISDGRVLHEEGEMALASGSWSGKVFEK